MAELPPPLQGPTAKEKKYDRQLRLWGAAGQQALEDSHILLVNSGPGVVGLETLKNLILPGIGQFTIQDEATVTEADLGINFFLEDQHLGKSRAECTCSLLEELNPDVKGHYVANSLNTWLNRDDVLTPYTFILVVAPIDPKNLVKLASYTTTNQIPLFHIHSIGFYSSVSAHLPPTFPVVDTHPDPETTSDLRLLKPWHELLGYAAEKTKDLDNMSADDHGHVPYVALLLHFIEEWKRQHEGNPPQHYKDKTAFRSMLAKAARTDNPEGGEENFDEAVSAVIKLLNLPEVSSAVREVFKESECVSLSADSAPFWIIAHAIGSFYDKHGVLPVPGAVPDMKARSVDYIELQNVYKTKARKDLAEVVQNVRSIETDLKMGRRIEEKDVEAFCKNAAHIKLVKGRPVHVIEPGRTLAWADRNKALGPQLAFPDSLLPIYIVIQAWDCYVAEHNTDSLGAVGRIPGQSDAEVESDVGWLVTSAAELIQDLTLTCNVSFVEAEVDAIKAQVMDLVNEFVRAGGSELHNIASLTGGFVSQEVIKVITKQYVPIDNTCIFDGIRSKTEVFRV